MHEGIVSSILVINNGSFWASSKAFKDICKLKMMVGIRCSEQDIVYTHFVKLVLFFNFSNEVFVHFTRTAIIL